MQSLTFLAVLGMVAAASAATCMVPCTKRVKTSTACGFFGWSRCTKYRTGSSTCPQTCTHGGWSTWTVKSEGACSAACGGGRKSVTYKRTCTNPAPSGAGRDCSGSKTKTEREDCNTHNCPIHGDWTKFELDSVSPCSASCGGGQKELVYKRTCTDPKPRYGGDQCSGSDTDVRKRDCNMHHCPVHGGWSQYTAWSDDDECNALCGGGKKNQTRTRTCTDPAPAYGGDDCKGKDTDKQTVTCNTEACGDKCPEAAVTYIANSGNASRYYICDNGVGRLMACPVNTQWSQVSNACVHKATTTTTTTTGAPSNGSGQAATCSKAGDLLRHESDCAKYYICTSDTNKIAMSCAPGLHWNVAATACDWPQNTNCPYSK